jgi:WD40 repeat protein
MEISTEKPLDRTEKKVTFGKPIFRQTPLPPGKGVIIAAAEGEECLMAAQSIQERLESLGCQVQVLHNPEHEILFRSKMPVIAMGNLANSRCVKYLYYKFLCLTDKSYPGKEGYNIRTLVDPFATGHNIIHIGYSDDDGLKNGVKAFLDKIQNPLPYINEVYYTRLAFDEEYISGIMQATLPEKIDLIPSSGATNWWQLGTACYITGNMDSFGTYLEGWRKMREISKKNDRLIINTHLYMTQHIEPWRLLEFSGMIPDDIRQDIEECLFRWAESSEGIGYAVAHSKNKNLPSHNHTMFCGLSLSYLADYFAKRYPEMEEPAKWKKIADDVFYSFNRNGWKPYCDDSTYSNQVSLPLVFSYSIFQDDPIFIKKNARKVIDWLKVIIGQNMFVPSYGDGSVSFPVFLTSFLSHYFEDGELRYILDCFKGPKTTLGIGKTRLFDSGVEPKVPSESGMKRIPIDSYIYDIWSENPHEGMRLTGSPPYGPKTQCFDKLSVRTGWDEIKDDYLLIDGLGSAGIHAYSDCMGILDYTSKGIVWLVEENDYRWPEPENCSILTIARDGYASDLPGYALIEEQKIIGKDQYYIRMRTDRYNQTRWIREIFLVKGFCVVFHDTVLIEEDGRYVIGAHFRTPAKAYLDGNTVKSKRTNPEGKTYELRLTCKGSTDVSINIEEIPYGERLFSYGGMYDKKEKDHKNRGSARNAMWKLRYNTDEVVVSAITSLASLPLCKNDMLSFTHLVHPAAEGEEDIRMEIVGQTLVLTQKDRTFTCPLTYTVSKKLDSSNGKRDSIEEASLSFKKRFVFPDRVNLLKVIDKDTFACALGKGKLMLYKKDSSVWEIPMEGEIHAIEYVRPENFLAVGHGNNHLTVVSMTGQVLWKQDTVRIPTLFPSWELPYPKVVSLRYTQEVGETVLIVGCGDNQIRTYDAKGHLLNAYYTYATVPDAVEVTDIDGDGVTEVMAEGKTESSSGTFYVHDIKGNPKRNIAVSGWLCNIRSHELRKRDDGYILVTGMNYSKNFKIFRIQKDQVTVVSEKYLGGTVNSVCINKDQTAVYAGTSKGSVLGFDSEGNGLWHVFVKDSVKKLYEAGESVTAICENGRVCTLSKDGSILGFGCLPEKPICFEKCDDEIWIGCGNEIVLI